MVQHDMAGTSADYLGVGWVSDLSTVQYPTVVHVAFFLSFFPSFFLSGWPNPNSVSDISGGCCFRALSHLLADQGAVEKRTLNGDSKGDAC